MARSYLFLAAGLTATKTKELNMSDTPKQNASGSTAPFAAELRAVLGSWPATAEAVERFKAEKAELKSAEERNRIIRRERHMANLTERAKRVLRGDVDDE